MDWRGVLSLPSTSCYALSTAVEPQQQQQQQLRTASRDPSTPAKTPLYLRKATSSPLFSPRRTRNDHVFMKPADGSDDVAVVTKNMASTSISSMTVQPACLDSWFNNTMDKQRPMLRLTAARGTELIYCVHATVEVQSTAKPRGDDSSSGLGSVVSSPTSKVKSHAPSAKDIAVVSDSFHRTVVRILNLAAWRRACTRSLSAELIEEHGEDTGETRLVDDIVKSVFDKVPYKELSTPLDYVVHQIEVNGNGRLLAAAGAEAVTVIVLPLFSKYSGNVKETKSYTIGGLGTGVSITRIKWHPLSDGHVHLMILSADGCLRMYNTSTNPDYPEQTFWFSDLGIDVDESLRATAASLDSSPKKSRNKSGMFGFDLDSKEAVSFDFGHGNSGWAPFTVFCLMRNGDLYSICPVLPKKSSIDVDHLVKLKAQTSIDWKQADSSDEFSERQYYWRNRWLDEQLDAYGVSSKIGSDAGAPLSFDRSTSSTSAPSSTTPSVTPAKKTKGTLSKLSLLRQGPFLISPIDEDVQESSACDLCVMSTDPFPVLAVSYKSGRVHLCLEAGFATEALWYLPDLNPVKDVTPRLYLYECVDLNEKGSSTPPRSTGAVGLYCSNTSPDVLLAGHDRGVHAISLSPWLDPLAQTVDDFVGGTSAELSQNVFRTHEFSEIQCLVDGSSHPSQCIGISLFADLVLGQTFVSLTAARQLHCKSFALRPKISDLTRGVSSLKMVSTPSTLNSTSSSTTTQKSTHSVQPYESILTAPFSIPCAIATEHASSRMPTTVTLGTSSRTHVDEVTLRKMSAKTVQMQKEIAELRTAGCLVDERAEDLNLELQSQEDYLHKLTDVIESKLSSKAQALEEKVEILLKRQNLLNSQCETILQILMDASQPRLSKEEIEFMEEIKAFSHRLRQSYKPQLLKLQEQRDALLPELTKMKNSVTFKQGGSPFDTSGALGSSQIQKIGQALSEEYKLITSTWQKFGEIQKAFETLA